MIALETPLTSIRGIGQKFTSKLKKMGIETVRDLLWHFPSRYEDFSQIYKIGDLIPNQEATVHGVIEEIETRRAWKRNLTITEALLTDESGSIRAVWFNQPYIKNTLVPGRLANFSGKVTAGKEDIHFSNPTYELVKTQNHADITRTYADTNPIHTARIIPIYPETKGLTSKGIRYLVKPILDNLPRLLDPLPESLAAQFGFPELRRALHDIHFPESLQEALRAKERFAFEDIFILQLFNVTQKLALREKRAPAFPIDIPFVKDLVSHLPFPLTFSQKRSLWEILKDTAKGAPMNRLLQGDVGSGKTIVAAIAALHTAHHGYETALMAPTEILARQHYETFKAFFGEFEGGVALMTAHEHKISYGKHLETTKKKNELLKELQNGAIKVLIGTHALIQKNIGLPNLGLIIIDEQHRFGVEQRASLLHRKTRNATRLPAASAVAERAGEDAETLPQPPASGRRDSATEKIPHFLSMSATPIPRTLSLTLFGDLELSLITELPKNRRPIITKAIPPQERAATYEAVKAQIRSGRQVFVICPRIEPREINSDAPERISFSEWQKLDVKSVTEEFERLSKKIFRGFRVAMLHGRMRAEEKERVMREYIEHRTDILVSTSVIEVGIDVPNATVILIEGADRFGLAQLYQFRGRVGRGAHQSYCFLFTDANSKDVRARLKAIVEAKNGLELAEKDLRQRGPGEFLGNAQTGMPDLAMKALQHPELVHKAREEATRLLKEDPLLKKHPLLKERLGAFQKEIHRE